jgi:hypothetical protein
MISGGEQGSQLGQAHLIVCASHDDYRNSVFFEELVPEVADELPMAILQSRFDANYLRHSISETLIPLLRAGQKPVPVEFVSIFPKRY